MNGGWQPDELSVGNPLKRVRQLLGGGWEWSTGRLREDMAMAAARGDRKVLVLRFPDHFDLDQAKQIVQGINEQKEAA
jgi:hypothetical protein